MTDVDLVLKDSELDPVGFSTNVVKHFESRCGGEVSELPLFSCKNCDSGKGGVRKAPVSMSCKGRPKSDTRTLIVLACAEGKI